MNLWDHIKPPPMAPPPPPPTVEQILKQLGRSYTDTFHNQSPGDHRLWIELYIIACGGDDRTADRLEYIRNVGAVLLPDDQWGFRIQPVIDPSGRYGWKSYDEYLRIGQSELNPYGLLIMPYLKELRRRYDNNLIYWWT